MLRNKKSMFSDEEESEDEDENAVRASQRNVFESDEEEGDENASPSSKKSNKGKQKRKRGGLLLDSDHDDEDSDSFENTSASKTKNRRGIIAYDSDSGDSDSSSGREGDGDGDDEENLCPICLGDFEDQMVGIPENCSHIFCITCIQEWSKNVNNCPVDRIKFNKITIKDMNGKFIDDVIVEDVKKDDNISDDPPTYCQVCGQCDREDCMLLCDECDNGYHMDCLTPPLECVPIDEWYCVECTPTEVSAPTSTRTRRATTNDEPAKTNRRSRRRSNNTNNESEDEREELVSSLMSDVMGAINRWGRGRNRSRGEGSNARQARTVASTRTDREIAVSERLSRLRARARSNPKKREKRKKKKARAAARKGKKKVAVIGGEFEKINDIAHDEGLSTGVSIFGNPLQLDCFEDSIEEVKEQSPVRSTIVDTPDVVGHILGLSTLHEEDLEIARDGHGTLRKKVKEEPQRKKNPVQSSINKKRKLRFQFDSDEDDNNDGDVDDDDYDTLKDKKAESIKIKKKKKLRILDDEDGDDDDKDSGENMDISDEEKTDVHSEKKVTKEKEEKARHSETATKSRIELANEKEQKSKEELYDKNRSNDSNNKSDKHVHFAASDEEPKERRSTLVENMRQRLKANMERKAKEEELRKECQKLRESNSNVEIKTNSSLVNVASFKIPKLKKKEEPIDNRSESEKRKQEKIKRFYHGLVLDQKTPSSEKTIKNKEKVSNSDKACEKINVSPSCHQEGSQRKNLIDSIKREAHIQRDNSVKKRPPLTDLEKKVRLYQEGALLSPEYKKKKQKKAEIDKKIDVPANTKNRNNRPNIECKSILSSKSNNERKPKKSISFNDYKVRKVCSESDDSQKNISKTTVDNNNEGLKEMNKMLFGDSDSESTDQTVQNDSSKISPNPSVSSSSTITNKKSSSDFVDLTKNEDINKRLDDQKKTDKKLLKQTNSSSSSSSSSASKLVVSKQNHESRTNNEIKISTSPTTGVANGNTQRLYSKYINPSSKLYIESNVLKNEKNNLENNNPKNNDLKSSSSLSQSNGKHQSELQSSGKQHFESYFSQKRHSELQSASKISPESSNSVNNKSESHSSKHHFEANNSQKHHSDSQSSRKHHSKNDKNYSNVDINVLNNDNKLDPSEKINEQYLDFMQQTSLLPKDVDKKNHTSNTSSKSSNSSKFDENSPYSVIRPFGLNPSSNTPVAVVSPSLRDDTTSANDLSLTTKSTNNQPHDSVYNNTNTKEAPTSKSNSTQSALKSNLTESIVNMKLELDTVTKVVSKEHSSKKSDDKVENKQKKSDNPYERADYINKIKEFLKDYYKKKLLTKEQWKLVVKTSVRLVHMHPEMYSTDEQIKWLVEKNAYQFIKLHSATSEDD